MTWILLVLLILTVAAIVAAVKVGSLYEKEEDGYDKDRLHTGRTVARIVAGVMVVLFVLMFGWATIKVVPETQAGVPVTFGKVGTTLSSGLNFVAPWTDVHTFPTRPVTVELAGEEAVQARTADSGQVTAEVAVRWKVDREKAPELFRQVRTGDDNKISDTVVEKNTRQAIGEVYTTYTNLEATAGDRAGAAQRIKEKLQEQVDPYGIIIEDVNLRSVEPDEQTAQVLSQLAQQKQRTQIAIEEGKTAAEAANVQKVQAQAQVDAANILAQTPQGAFEFQCLAVLREAITAKVPIYVNPCGGDAVGVGVLAQP